MATTDTPTTKPATSTSDSKESKDKDTREKMVDSVPEVKAEDIEKVMEDPRFSLPTKTITTAEDAYQAYLREEIDESELRAVVSLYGNPKFAALKNNLERPDNAFKRTVPEDLYDDPSLAVSPVEERLKVVEDRQQAAHEATEAAELEQTVKS
jgi:hypothetical protein